MRAYFALHYSEPEGFDCGIHCEPNPHVDGLCHDQKRVEAGRYTDEPVGVGARSAAGLVWELLDGVAERLDAA